MDISRSTNRNGASGFNVVCSESVNQDIIDIKATSGNLVGMKFLRSK